MGLLLPDTQLPQAIGQRTGRHRGLQTVCSGRTKTLMTCRHRARAEVEEAAPLPSFGLRASCSQKVQIYYHLNLSTLSTSTAARLYEALTGEEPQNSLDQKRIPACPLVRVLFLAGFCYWFLKENTKERQHNLLPLNQATVSQSLLERGPSQCTGVY